jgi:lipopolysaccharide export system permease protein
MSNADYIDRLNNLENKQLIDIVKNYKQYGYDKEIRDKAILLLEERGVSQEHLRLTGNLENTDYSHAIELYASFVFNSRIAFFLYLSILLNSLLIPLFLSSYGTFLHFGSVANWVLPIFYFTFLIKSFLDQDQLYKKINAETSSENILVYLFLGIPFYILAYFYFKNQIKEKMKEIL